MSAGAVFDVFALLHINLASPTVVREHPVSVADLGQHDELKIVITCLLVQDLIGGNAADALENELAVNLAGRIVIRS